MVIPKRLKSSRLFKKITDEVIAKIPLPRINPNIVSMLTVVFSVMAFISYRYSAIAFFALTVLSLLLDGLDGAIARRYGLSSEQGYLCDVLCDRLSEAFTFINFIVPWFLLFMINLFLSFYSIERKRHISLPLRAVFIAYYLFFVLI